MKTKHRPPRAQQPKTEIKIPNEPISWIANTLILLGIALEEWHLLVERSRNGPAPKYQVSLSRKEKLILRKRALSTSISVRDKERARIILLAETRLGVTVMGDVLGYSRERVRRWCRRFTEKGLDGLQDQPRDGAPRSVPELIIISVISYVIEEKTRNREARTIEDEAERPVSQLGDRPPLSRLSGRDIHQLLIRDFGDDAPCLSTVYRILKRLKLRPWLNQSWIHIRDPRFWEKASVILDLYNGTYRGEKLGEGEYVVCADEITQLQILERIVTPGKPGHLRKVDFEYVRHGVLKMHAARDVSSGEVYHRFTEGSNMAEFREFVHMVMSMEPYASARRVFWVVDNGSCHHPNTFGDWLKREYGGRAVAVHTPAHGSWLNQVELFFSILVRKALTPRNFASAFEMMIRIGEFIEHRNKDAKPFNWTYTKQKLGVLLERLKAEGLYPPPSGPLDVEGIGAAKRKTLLEAFGSTEGVREATMEEIKVLPGFGNVLAKRLYTHLHGDWEAGTATPITKQVH